MDDPLLQLIDAMPVGAPPADAAQPPQAQRDPLVDLIDAMPAQSAPARTSFIDRNNPMGISGAAPAVPAMNPNRKDGAPAPSFYDVPIVGPAAQLVRSATETEGERVYRQQNEPTVGGVGGFALQAARFGRDILSPGDMTVRSGAEMLEQTQDPVMAAGMAAVTQAFNMVGLKGADRVTAGVVHAIGQRITESAARNVGVHVAGRLAGGAVDGLIRSEGQALAQSLMLGTHEASQLAQSGMEPNQAIEQAIGARLSQFAQAQPEIAGIGIVGGAVSRVPHIAGDLYTGYQMGKSRLAPEPGSPGGRRVENESTPPQEPPGGFPALPEPTPERPGGGGAGVAERPDGMAGQVAGGGAGVLVPETGSAERPAGGADRATETQVAGGPGGEPSAVDGYGRLSRPELIKSIQERRRGGLEMPQRIADMSDDDLRNVLRTSDQLTGQKPGAVAPGEQPTTTETTHGNDQGRQETQGRQQGDDSQAEVLTAPQSTQPAPAQPDTTLLPPSPPGQAAFDSTAASVRQSLTPEGGEIAVGNRRAVIRRGDDGKWELARFITTQRGQQVAVGRATPHAELDGGKGTAVHEAASFLSRPSVGAAPAPVLGKPGAGGVAGIDAGGVPPAAKRVGAGAVDGGVAAGGVKGLAGVDGGHVAPVPDGKGAVPQLPEPDAKPNAKGPNAPLGANPSAAQAGDGARGVKASAQGETPKAFQARDQGIRDTFAAKGAGHKTFADRLDRMVADGTMSGAAADLIMATPHLLNASDEHMARVRIASTMFTRQGGSTPSGRTYDPLTGKSVNSKSEIAAVELQKGIEEALRKTGRIDTDLDLHPVVVMLEEWAHAASGLAMSDAQRSVLMREYLSKTQAEWADDFMDGIANGNRDAAEYAAGVGMPPQEAFEEWFAHKAIEHMLGNKSDNAVHRSIMDRVLAAFKAALEHIRKVMGGVPEHLRPLFDAILHGERQAPEPPQKATRPRAPRQPSPEGLMERGTSAKEPSENRVSEKKTQAEAPKQPVQAAVEPSSEVGQSGLGEVRPLAQPTERPAGLQRETAAKPQPAPMTRVEPGRATTLELPNGRSVQVQYRMVEAGELTPSHDARNFFRKNPAGDDNERPYEDEEQGAPSRLQVQKIAEIPKPHLILTDTPVATDGPPIVDERGVVLGGNARTMALQMAYDKIPSSAQVYRNAMIEAAPRFGIDTAKAAQFQQPVIVRAMSQEDAGAPGEMSRVLNQSMTAGRTSSADAISRGKKIDAPTASLITKAIEDRSLAEALNSDRTAMQIVRAMTEAGAWDDKDTSLYVEGGSLNAEGKKVIERTLLGSIIPDIAALSELKPETRQLLIRSAGPMIRLRKAMSKDDSDMDFDKTLSGAVEVMAKRRSGGYDSVDELMAESLNSDGALSDPRAVAMARAMENNKPTQFADLMNRTADAVAEAQAGQVSMALGRAPSAGEAFDSALSGGGGGLFGRGLFGNDEKEPPSMLRLQRVEHASGEPGFQMVDERTGQPVSRIYRDYDIARREMAALNAVRKDAAKKGDQVWRDTSEFGQEFKQSEKDRTREVSKDKETGTLFGRAIDQSNQDELGFYSRLGAWVNEKMRGPMQADQLRKAIANAGLPADEIKWTGLDDWLAKRSGAVKPEEVRKYLDENRVVLREVVKGTQEHERDQTISDLTGYIDAARQRLNAWISEYVPEARDTPSETRRNVAQWMIESYNTDGVGKWEDVQYQAKQHASGYADPSVEQRMIRSLATLPEPPGWATLMEKIDEREKALRARPRIDRATQFERFTLPGGENYREVLLTLPPPEIAVEYPPEITELPPGYDLIEDSSQPEHARWGITPPGQSHARPFAGRWMSPERAKSEAIARLRDDAYAKAEQERRDKVDARTFKSSHFSEPNIIAHLRIKDRVTPDGRRVMFLEEVQSDWHEAGRDRGYRQPPATESDIDLRRIESKVPDGEDAKNYPGYWESFDRRTGRLITRHSGHTSREAAMKEAVMYGKPDLNQPPNAPWSKTWHEMAFRRALRLASQGGYDALGWTTGATQAERYSLGDAVRNVDWETLDGGVRKVYVATSAHDGVDFEVKDGKVFNAIGQHAGALGGKDLREVVGADLARRINSEDKGSVPGGDIRIGGEGMSSFYDRDLPNYARRYGKKWGVQPEMGKVGTGDLTAQERKQGFNNTNTQAEADAHLLPITPEMTKSVAEEGQPLFGRAFHGSPHTFDKFSTDKIGTGEGAQSYGYGLYFAGNKEVAEHYQSKLALPRIFFDGQEIKAWKRDGGVLAGMNDPGLQKLADDGKITESERRAIASISADQSVDAAIKNLHAQGDMTWRSEGARREWHELADTLERLKPRIRVEQTGRMYEVELAPEESDYLLWDRPLSEQSEKVRRALLDLRGTATTSENNGVHERYGGHLRGGEGRVRGSDLYHGLTYDAMWGMKRADNPEKAASDYLHSLGIRGIKYLDGSSRRVDVTQSAETGKWFVAGHPRAYDTKQEAERAAEADRHYNYVLFSDDDVEIKARYGRSLFDRGDEDKPSTPAPESSLFAGKGPGEIVRGAKPGEGRQSPTKPDKARRDSPSPAAAAAAGACSAPRRPSSATPTSSTAT